MWWPLFSLPLLRRVPEPPVAGGRRRRAIAHGVRRACCSTLRELRRYRQAFLMLVAFLLYNDGIGTIIRMATLYGTQVGIDQGSLIGALMIVQFVGMPATFVFGAVAAQVGAKPAILGRWSLYSVIARARLLHDQRARLLVLAALVGLVQGGSQALSRSLFASLIPEGSAPSSSGSSRSSRSSPGSSARWCSRWRSRSPARTAPRSCR